MKVTGVKELIRELERMGQEEDCRRAQTSRERFGIYCHRIMGKGRKNDK